MIEDKLTRDERIRLEALAQANAAASFDTDPDARVQTAKRFEDYIREGK